MKKIYVCLCFIFVFFTSAQATTEQSSTAPEIQDRVYKKLQVFSRILQYIESNYIEDVKIESLLDDAMKGLTSGLDPHTAYLPPEYYREMKVDTSGHFDGVGIEIGVSESRDFVVITPTKGGPAEQAGVEMGDKILSVAGQSTKDLNLVELVKLIRGKKGSEVKMILQHANEDKPYEVTLKRKTIKIKSVQFEKLEHDLGYIQIKSFQEKTDREVRKAFLQLDKKENLKGLVLDLRNNPGGLLSQAQLVSDLFLESGVIVSTKGKNGAFVETLHAKKEGTLRFVPIIVLINGGTASAAEIVAGALQDHKRAVLLGTPSFGKGSVQTIIDLEDGSGLKLTVARYYTPKGRAIQAVGDFPDVYVSNRAIAVESENEARALREKDLKGRLKTLSESGKEREQSGKENDANAKNDLQLERALEYLRTWDIFRKPFSSHLKKKVS